MKLSAFSPKMVENATIKSQSLAGAGLSETYASIAKIPFTAGVSQSRVKQALVKRSSPRTKCKKDSSKTSQSRVKQALVKLQAQIVETSNIPLGSSQSRVKQALVKRLLSPKVIHLRLF